MEAGGLAQEVALTQMGCTVGVVGGQGEIGEEGITSSREGYEALLVPSGFLPEVTL